ncbi:ribonuclease P protein component [Aureibaculum sp. A20]|uniref:Ribonuclease P protein component n=1 Tax=Aureibaculum flavum TaxID=2795986 RepID=A0ABS0WQN0_9FLAO|nr:ribonuclease P protein component [Aureibaculum flavum]MBJ2174286.1 ribonuclease P protein component [Aureibaculum flavum]
MKFSLKKEEKLKSKILIGELFEKGKSLSKFPLRLVYLKSEHSSNYPIKVAFSAPKRRFKKAVDRNRIKRLMREAYRKNKHILYSNIEEKYIIMFTYLDENELKYVEIEEKLILLLKRLSDKIKSCQHEES